MHGGLNARTPHHASGVVPERARRIVLNRRSCRILCRHFCMQRSGTPLQKEMSTSTDGAVVRVFACVHCMYVYSSEVMPIV